MDSTHELTPSVETPTKDSTYCVHVLRDGRREPTPIVARKSRRTVWDFMISRL